MLVDCTFICFLLQFFLNNLYSHPRVFFPACSFDINYFKNLSIPFYLHGSRKCSCSFCATILFFATRRICADIYTVYGEWLNQPDYEMMLLCYTLKNKFFKETMNLSTWTTLFVCAIYLWTFLGWRIFVYCYIHEKRYFKIHNKVCQFEFKAAWAFHFLLIAKTNSHARCEYFHAQ